MYYCNTDLHLHIGGESSGSGGGHLTMLNGSAFVSTSLAPGDYKIIVKVFTDSDVEVNSERKNFAIASRSSKTSSVCESLKLRKLFHCISECLVPVNLGK